LKNIIIICLCFGLLFVTNPSLDDFSNFMQEHVADEVMQETNNGFLSSLGGGLVKLGIKGFTTRQDYKIFSIYSIRIDKEYKFIGIGTIFFEYN